MKKKMDLPQSHREGKRSESFSPFRSLCLCASVAILFLPLFCAPLFAAAPVFLGSTLDYWTNSGANLILVRSNHVEVVIDRGTGQFLIFGGQLSVSTGAFSRVTIGLDGLRVESSSVNLTNLPGTGAFVAISTTGGLFRTNVPTATNFDGIVVTNGTASVIATATRTGGALTNITLNAQGPAVVHVDGSTNVNIVALMNWVAGLQRPVTLLITNRTATPRTVSLGATTNNWIGMGVITAPWQNTNALWIACENIGTSNTVYAAQYMTNPTN